MKKKILLISLALLLIASIVAVGCAAPAPEPEKTFRWRFAMYNPAFESAHGRAYQLFAKDVFETTNGRLLIDIYPAGTLGYSGFTHHQVVGDGLLEIGDTTAAAVKEQPYFEIFGQVMLFLSMEDGMKAWWAAMDAGLQDKAAARFNTKVLIATCKPNDILHSTTGPFPTVDSLKGAKIRAWSALISMWLDEIGALPLVVPYAERYTALATGIVEGNFASPESQVDTKDYEVCPYSNLWPLTIPIYWVAVNLDEYNALPADVRDGLLAAADRCEQKYYIDYKDSFEPNLKILEDLGVIIVPVADEEIAKAQAAAEVVWKDWLEDAGPEGREIFDLVLDAMGYPPLSS